MMTFIDSFQSFHGTQNVVYREL